jgi:hypothetical protein
MNQVFISYPSRDPSASPHVDMLSAEIARRGWKPWIDTEGVRAGDPLHDTIRQAARECHACVVVAPESGAVTPWMRWEMEAFLVLGKQVLILDPWMGERSLTGLPVDLVHRRMEDHAAPILKRLDDLLGGPSTEGPSTGAATDAHQRTQFAHHALIELEALKRRGAYAQILTLGPVLQRHLWLILQFEEMVAVAALVKHAADRRAVAEGGTATREDLEHEMIAQTDGVGWGNVMLGQFDAANDALEVAEVSLDELRDHGSPKVPYWATKVLRHRGAMLVHQAYREGNPHARSSLLGRAVAKLEEAQRSAADIPQESLGSGKLDRRGDMLAGIDHDLALAYVAMDAFAEAGQAIARLTAISDHWTPDKACRIPLLKAWRAHRESERSAPAVRAHRRGHALTDYRAAIARARTSARWDIALWAYAGAASLTDDDNDRDQLRSNYALIRDEWVASDAVHEAMLHRGPVVGLIGG